MTPSTDPEEPRTFRGSTLEEVLPRIREELGPDAVVLRQRTGLTGGMGGFFQHRCVEVVARRSGKRLDVYDEPPGIPSAAESSSDEEALAEGLSSPAIQEILSQAAPFAEQLQAADEAAGDVEQRFHTAANGTWFTAAVTEPEPEPAFVPPVTPTPAPEAPPEPAPAAPAVGAEPVPPVEPAPAVDPVPVAVAGPTGPAPRSGAALIHERTLMAAGITPALADELVSETVSHAVPFASTRAMKRLLRMALARRIPLARPPGAGGRAIALVGAGGSGKTLTAARIAAAYTAGSDLPVEVLALGSDGGLELGALLAPAGVPVGDGRAWAPPKSRTETLTVLDTPAISPSSESDVRTLGALLERLRACEVHVTVSATMSGPAVRRLLDSLAPLRPHAVVLTHLDEVAHAGPVLDEIMARGLGLSYCGTGTGLDGLAPADPLALAAAVLP